MKYSVTKERGSYEIYRLENGEVGEMGEYENFEDAKQFIRDKLSAEIEDIKKEYRKRPKEGLTPWEQEVARDEARDMIAHVQDMIKEINKFKGRDMK